MGFIAFSYLNYSLILGHLFGLCVLIIYVLCIDSIIKNIFIEIKDINKKHKKRECVEAYGQNSEGTMPTVHA